MWTRGKMIRTIPHSSSKTRGQVTSILKGAEFKAAGNREGGSKWHTHIKRTTVAQFQPILPWRKNCRWGLPAHLFFVFFFKVAGKWIFIWNVPIFQKLCGPNKIICQLHPIRRLTDCDPVQKVSGIILKGPSNHSLIRWMRSRSGKEASLRCLIPHCNKVGR